MKQRLTIILVLAALIILTGSAVHAMSNGVDDLRGRWDVDWDFADNPDDPPGPLTWYVQDIIPNPDRENAYLANGCMHSPDTGVWAPLSLQAIYQSEENAYELQIYSTIVPFEGEPFVIRFDGWFEVNGSDVVDDQADGTFVSEPGEGEWSARHHDRRRPECPAVEAPELNFDHDVYTHNDRSYSPAHISTLLEGFTKIVSSAMQITAPDGEVIIAPFYTDLFSPEVNFISDFRFITSYQGAPIVDQLYSFVLLDALGEPISGTEREDFWTGCPQEAPTDLFVSEIAMTDDVLLSWTFVPVVSGQFEPAADPQIGMYQIGVGPLQEGATDFGANGIKTPSHMLPWNHFNPGDQGNPDGWDYGVSLSELEDNDYLVSVEAFSQPDPSSGAYGHECSAFKTTEFLVMTKQGDQLSFIHPGAIAGTVTDQAGVPLAGIWVDACEYDNEFEPFCRSAETNEEGMYVIATLPEGDYRVSAGGGYYQQEVYRDPDSDDERVGVLNGQITEDIDFALSPGGAIAGTITDDAGNPLEFIFVEVCEYYNEEPNCAGAESNESGQYEVGGLPAGEYRVRSGGGEWAIEYYNEQVNHQDATPVPVVVGATTPNIDFTLALGGWISGTVYGPGGEPLGGIGVDIEGGGFGTCTDENGEYTLEGLPLGTYTVVAGHEFCGVSGYMIEAIQGVELTDEYRHAGGIDFHLELAPEPSPQYLNVQPDHGWADSGGWEEGSSVTLSYVSNEIQYAHNTIVDAFGAVQFNLVVEALSPGVVVAVTDGVDSKELTIVQASFVGADDVDNTAWGTGPAGAWIGVGIVDENEDHFWVDNVQVDEFGNWFVDFDDHDQNFGAVTDAWLHVFDEDGDSTIAHLDLSQ